MIYVPIVTTPAGGQPPSPRTRELADLLAKVLEEYTKAHPTTTQAEIRAAVRMAQMVAGPDRTRVASVLSVTVGVVIGLVTLGLVFFQNSGDVEVGPALPMIIMALVILLGIVFVMVRLKGR